MRILFLGDLFGHPGRLAVANELDKLKQTYQVDLVIANAENCSHGKGLIPAHYTFLKNVGIDFLTMGNHTWAKHEIASLLDNPDLVRPLNLKPDHQYAQKGAGSRVINVRGYPVRITNLLGWSVYFKDKFTTNPFQELSALLQQTNERIHIVDFHAETTSEKNAFGVYFDGQVSAILGTHTHVPTNDLRISPKGTVYITDVGMCGPGFGSVIGAAADAALPQFVPPISRFKLVVAKNAGYQLNGVFFEIDENTGKALKCEQIRIVHDDPSYLQWTYQPAS